MSRSSFWHRALAAFIDLSLLIGVAGLIQVILTRITGGRLQAGLFEQNNRWLSYGYLLLTMSWLPFNLYFSVMESSARQASLGKRWLGLRVTDLAGRRIGFIRAIVRTTLKFLPWELGHISIILLGDLTVTGLVRDGDFPFTPDTRFYLEETGWTGPVRVLALGLLGANILFVAIQRQRRGWHDLAAGTIVTPV